MRPWPKSLAGQLTLVLVLALLIAQSLVFVLFAGERVQALRTAYRENVVVRTAALVRLIEETPPALHERILQAASSQLVRFSLTAEPALAEDARDPRTVRLTRDIATALGVAPDRLRVLLTEETFVPLPPFVWRSPRGDSSQAGNDDEDRHRAMHRRHWREREDEPSRRVRWIAFSIRMADGSWLNGMTGPPPLPPPFGLAFLASLLASMVAVAAAGILVARRITRPMRRLAEAADRLGRGEGVVLLPEAGPDEVRRGMHAFNEMQERLNRFVRDRTHMLAAVSHDLRTPITSLRLRAELVEDAETREKMIETVDEMGRMVEATLDFIRAEGRGEETRDTDLCALVDSLADDLTALDGRVTVAEGPRVVARCRPLALRRALRNVIENAIHYGGGADVRLEREGDTVRILVEDNGPGIADADLDRVFEPFVRAEASRSRVTGGIGLGLAIARTILRGHGGDIVLGNRPEGGLRATVTLPAGRASGPGDEKPARGAAAH